MDTVRASTRSEAPRQQTRTIPLSEPFLNGNEWTYVKTCLDSGWVSSAGPIVSRFEEAVASYVGAPEAVATASGTAALHLALQLAGVQPDEEVLVSDLTFIAPVNAIRYVGAWPVFMDAEPRTWQMDADKVEGFLREECRVRGGRCYHRRTRRRVRAILPVHILGLACAMDRLVDLARRYRLVVIEDAAEGMGVRYRGRHVGTFGKAGILSFNGNKIMTAAGGGMLITSDRALARRARYLSTQAKDDPVEHVHAAVGYNYRLSGVQAAIGLAQLEQLEPFIARKAGIAARYRTALDGVRELTLMPAPADVRATYWLFTVLLPEGTTVARRKQLIGALHEQGIGARPFWHPMHQLKLFRGCQAFAIDTSPRLYARGVSLPSSVSLTDVDVDRCARTVLRVLETRR